MVDWAPLRREVYRAHTKPGSIPPVAECPWCGEGIRFDEDWHLHEALIKRSQVHPSKQHLIFVSENCVPLHELCHHWHGQTREMKRRCLKALIRRPAGASLIAIWYATVAPKLGLSIVGDEPLDHAHELRIRGRNWGQVERYFTRYLFNQFLSEGDENGNPT